MPRLRLPAGARGRPLPELETDYSMGDTEQLDTRIRAFLAMLA